MMLLPRFVDREREIEALRSWSSAFRGLPLYIYGPEGCGKTRLVREFVSMFSRLYGGNAFAIYIDALERDSVDRAILHSDTVELSMDVLKSIVDTFTGLRIGEALANKLATIFERIALRRKLEDSYIIVVIDDVVQAIGLEKIEWYVKWLYELMWKLSERYRPRAINFVVTTSEGLSRRSLSRHRHAHIVLLWNMDSRGFEKLFQELSPPPNIDYERIWLLLGGNPGKLVELAMAYSWNIDTMMARYEAIAKELVLEIKSLDLLKELKLILDDVDALAKQPSPKLRKLVELLTERNLMIYIDWPTLTGVRVEPNPDIGIGRSYAWQTPLYMTALRRALSEVAS